jgi:serine/threonine protein phosphatase PrpC
MLVNEFAAKSVSGPLLKINEDRYNFDPAQKIFGIVDSAGGAGIGDRRSKDLIESLSNHFFQMSKDKDATMPLYWSPRWTVEGNAFINAVLHCHQSAFVENQKKPWSQRALSSFVGGVLSGSTLTLVKSGTCQAYHYRAGQLVSLVIDDSLNHLIQFEHHPPFYQVPSACFGMFPDLHWTGLELRLAEGDGILICTSNVGQACSPSSLRYIFEGKNLRLSQRLDELMRDVNRKGNQFNQTILALQF